MSKFLNMGVPLEEVIARSTWAPARAIRHEELGHLSVGAIADIAVFRVEKGDFGFVDVYKARMRGTQRMSLRVDASRRQGGVGAERHYSRIVGQARGTTSRRAIRDGMRRRRTARIAGIPRVSR